MERYGSKNESLPCCNPDEWLDSKVAQIKAQYNSHLLVYAGTLPSEQSVTIPLRKRQSLPSHIMDTSDPTLSEAVLAPSFSPIMSTSGIFKKYQLFTSDLILALLITFGLLIPITLIAVHSMASLKAPDRYERPPPSGGDRKQQ